MLAKRTLAVFEQVSCVAVLKNPTYAGKKQNGLKDKSIISISFTKIMLRGSK
jgi:hypothetical protein